VRIWIGPFRPVQEALSCSLVLKSAWICFRTSFSLEGNNRSLQILGFWDYQRSNGHFSAFLTWMRQALHLIVHIYYGMNLKNTLCLSHLFYYQCLAGKAIPRGNNVPRIFHQTMIPVLIIPLVNEMCVYFCCL
jgi:hypothetical protein